MATQTLQAKDAPRFKRRDARLTIEIKASPERAYRALTSARELRSWWLARAETDVRNMGRVRMVWPPHRGRSPEVQGVFVDLEPGRKVACLWGSGSRKAGVPPLNTFFIEPRPDGACAVTALHAGFSASPAADRRFESWKRRWEDCLAKLALYLESGRVLKRDELTFSGLALLGEGKKR